MDILMVGMSIATMMENTEAQMAIVTQAISAEWLASVACMEIFESVTPAPGTIFVLFIYLFTALLLRRI